MSAWKKTPPFKRNKKKEFLNIASTSQFIYMIGESDTLRKKSAEVPISEIKTAQFREKIKYIKSCMRKFRKLTGMGRGIAAVQVGIPQRFAVIYTKEKLTIIINPKITNKSKDLYVYPEVCMSAQPLVAKVARPSWVEFEYFDEDGEKQYWKTKDTNRKNRVMNRVFQHEIDHMNGIINIDYVRGSDLFFDIDPKFYKNAKFEKVKSRR